MSYERRDISLPEGYRAVQERVEVNNSPVAVCLITHTSPSSGTPFILLRETTDDSIYLGCLVDYAGDPKGWLEIWVQNVDRMAQSFRTQLEAVNNSLVDRRWSERLAVLRRLDRSALIETGWETVRPPPAFVQANAKAIVHPLEPFTNRPFVLCTEDAALASAGLPAYTSSLHRYLWSGGETPIFVAAANGAPTPVWVQSGPEAFPNLSPFNPSGGFPLGRSFCPLKLSQFFVLLPGKSLPGFSYGRTSFDPWRCC